MDFRTLILEARKAIGKGKPATQEELAAVLGVAGSSVQNWESGRTRPARKHLEKIAEAIPALAQRALALRSYEWHHRGKAPRCLDVPSEFIPQLQQFADRFSVDIGEVLRQALKVGVTSLARHSTEDDFTKMIRRQADINRETYERTRSVPNKKPRAKTG